MATAQAVARLRLDRSAPALACVAGATVLLLVAVAVAAAHPEASPLSPDHPGGDNRWSVLYLGALSGAFAAYVIGVAALARRAARLGVVLFLAVLIQVVPLAGPVLLSTDVYTYWAYGRVGAVHGENPYVVPPSSFPDDPAYAVMGEDWRETTTVYGPGFTLVSEAVAAAVGDSPSAAAWAYRGLATAAMLAVVALAATLARRRSLAAAFVGWNPLLAVHFAGGGHNDSWMMALVLAALVLATSGRRQLAGAAWAGSISIKWIPLAFLGLRGVQARATRREVRHLGFAVAAVALCLLAYWRYGIEWIRAVVPLARNLEQQAVYSIPHRLSDLGVPERVAAGLFAGLLVAAFAWLLVEAHRGRARLGLTAGLMLAATPWLVPWYAVWAVSLAAVEEDRAARLLALALSAYLLRDAVPL